MDLAKTIVRSCVRSFYSTREILIVDALAVHSALRDDDLAYLMAMNTKDLRKLCANLIDVRFLAMHTRSELKEGQTRPVSRTYYFIDYRQAIDGIKWRVYKLQQDNKAPVVPASERKEYVCPRCKAEWTLMEVVDNASPEGLRCHKCDGILIQNADGQSEGQIRVTRLNTQLDFLVTLLNEIDDTRVPDNSFEKALAAAVTVERDVLNPGIASVPVETDRPTAVRGLAAMGPDHLDINIHQGEGKSAEEIEAEDRRKAKLAKQNELPAWMLNSTIDGAVHKIANDVPVVQRDLKKDLKQQETLDAQQEEEMKKVLQAIKEQNKADELRRQQEKEAEGEEEDEDDDLEFEDVVETPSRSATPAVVVSIPASKPAVPSPLRPSRDDAINGGNSGSPLPDRPAKKVKVEEAIKAADEDDEDDVEFEDV